jgi:hypothetical protein
LRDEVLALHTSQLEQLSDQPDLPPLPDTAEIQYAIPPSQPAAFVYQGLALDEIEDRLIESAAYRQVRRTLLRERGTVRGRPLTPLHGGHVGLLCTAGMLNGVFGEGESRHVANWQSRKYTRTWQEEDDGKNIHHTREYFTHECTLLWVNGTTQILTHEASQEEGDDDPEASGPEFTQPRGDSAQAATVLRDSKVIVMPSRGATPERNNMPDRG